jgi:hypothetical protein
VHFFYFQLTVSTVDSFSGRLGILAPPFANGQREKYIKTSEL